MKHRRILMIIGTFIIVALLAFTFIIPYGLSADKPQAEITVYLTDLTSGNLASASVLIGQPTNNLAISKPAIPFQPLAGYQTTQEVIVNEYHQYSFYFTVNFKYSGSGIASWNSAIAKFSAVTPNSGKLVGYITPVPPPPDGWVNTANPYRIYNIANWDTDGKTTVSLSSLPAPGTPIMMSSSQSDQFYRILIVTDQGLKFWIPIFGGGLNNSVLSVDISVSGTDVNNRKVTASITGNLVIKAKYTGSITLEILSMSATIR